MKIYPAIDLMGGQAVRLQQGKADQKTVYSDNPPEMALQWVQAGAEYLHIVDLDAAFGTGNNLSIVAEIVRVAGIPCQLGGGMRTMQMVQAAFDAGVHRVVIGSKACEDAGFIPALSERHGSSKIASGVDARDGMVAVKGWTEVTNFEAVEFAQRAVAAGAGIVIYTDISTDGMLTGPNLPAVRRMNQALDVPLIASGGVGTAEDIRSLAMLGGLDGVIVGKALYDEKFTLTEAIQATRVS